MSEYNKYDMSDLVTNAIEQQPIEFIQSFNALLVDRINDAIADRKIEIAQRMFSKPIADDNSEEE